MLLTFPFILQIDCWVCCQLTLSIMFSYGTKATLHGGQDRWARTQGAAHHILAVLALRRLPSRYIHVLRISTIALISLTPLPLLYPPRAQLHSGKLFLISTSLFIFCLYWFMVFKKLFSKNIFKDFMKCFFSYTSATTLTNKG